MKRKSAMGSESCGDSDSEWEDIIPMHKARSDPRAAVPPPKKMPAKPMVKPTLATAAAAAPTARKGGLKVRLTMHVQTLRSFRCIDQPWDATDSRPCFFPSLTTNHFQYQDPKGSALAPSNHSVTERFEQPTRKHEAMTVAAPY